MSAITISLAVFGLFFIFKPSTQYGGSAAVQVSQFPNLVSGGLPCGYYRLGSKDLVTVQSNNYGIGAYSTAASCDWRFTGDGSCGVWIRCPCFEVPASFQCFGDHLKFTDTVIYNQKFCGDVAPQGAYRTVSGLFRIRFRSDGKKSSYGGRGFVCYIGCSVPGQADIPIPPQTCFMPPPVLTTSTTFNPFATTTTTVNPSLTTTSTSTLSTPITTTGSTSPTTTTPPLGPVTFSPATTIGVRIIYLPAGCRWWRGVPIGETIYEPRTRPTQKPEQKFQIPEVGNFGELPPNFGGLPPWCQIGLRTLF